MHARGPRAEQEGKLENGYYSREAKAERSRVRAAILALRRSARSRSLHDYLWGHSGNGARQTHRRPRRTVSTRRLILSAVRRPALRSKWSAMTQTRWPQLVTSPAIECALWQAPAVVGLQLAAVGALLSWCADSKKAPTKPGLQLPIRRTRPVLTRPRSDNYDARLPRRRQSNIASSSPGSLGP